MPWTRTSPFSVIFLVLVLRLFNLSVASTTQIWNQDYQKWNQNEN